MIDVEPLIESGLARMMPLPTGETADWEGVLRRARFADGTKPDSDRGIGILNRRPRARKSRRRMQILVILALVIALLAAVPALSGGGYGRVIHWLAGKPPKDVVEGLRHFDQGLPKMAPHPIVGKTGLVYSRQTPFGQVRVWLTPTKGGRSFCESVEAPIRPGRTGSVTGTCFAAVMHAPIEVSASWSGLGSAGYLQGRVNPAIVRLELRYVNGSTEKVPLQNGFFVAAIEAQRILRLSDHPHELVGYGSSGKALAAASVDNIFRGPPPEAEMPPVADADKERPALSLALGAGSSVTLSLSPSRAEGLCDRVSIAGVDWAWTCTDADTLSPPLRYTVLRRAVDHGSQVATVFFGVVRTGMTLTFRYQDGQSAEVPLTDQRFLLVLPPEKWRRGHRLSEIDVKQGNKIAYRVPMATDDGSYNGPADPPPRPTVVQVQDPADLPIIARLTLRGSHGERLEFLVRRQTPTHWFEVLRVDGKAVLGENLQWFAGGHDATIDVGWVPMRRPQFDVTRPLSVFLGTVRSPAEAARVIYADGSSELFDLATPTTSIGHGIHGWFVYEMTDERRARHPIRFEALDGAGKVIGRSAVPKGA
jgi:hypothetical protein